MKDAVFALIAYYEYVNADRPIHPLFDDFHLKQSYDPKNERNNGLWWDMVPIECIVRKLCVIPDYGSQDLNYVFVDWDPLLS